MPSFRRYVYKYLACDFLRSHCSGSMIMEFQSLILYGLAFILAFHYLYRRLARRPSVVDTIRGPPPSTWLAGNMPDLLRSREVGDAAFAWTKQYGNVVKIHSELGAKVLFISDPKALHYLLNVNGYNIRKTPHGRSRTGLLMGRGLVWAEGEQHVQQRKIITPAFSPSALKEFIPLFRVKAQKLVSRLKEQIQSSKDANPNVINVKPWLSLAALDVIGAAAADYDFGALSKGGFESKLAQAYSNLMADAFYRQSDVDIVVAYLLGRAPDFVFSMMKYLPTKSLKRIKSYMSVVTSVADEVVKKQTTLYREGKEGSKDLMSILVRANLSENPKSRLDNTQIRSQLTTFFFAGHETTGSTMTWILFELSKHPKYQAKVREEIISMRARLFQKKQVEVTVTELDSMYYLNALIKETLRFHPTTPGLIREMREDMVIPLSEPIKATTGEDIASIPVERGQQVYLAILTYNRLKSVWGSDADEWRPERFLNEDDRSHHTNVGVIGNIASFGSGNRSCIGWKFALMEMQIILMELIESFEFSPAPGNIEILRAPAGLMSPMVKGSKTGRVELPLTLIPI